MNSGKTGKTDLIIKHNGILVECDVKQLVWDSRCNGFHYRGTAAKGVCPLVVDPCTGKVRWVRGHEPTGLENFWD